MGSHPRSKSLRSRPIGQCLGEVADVGEYLKHRGKTQLVAKHIHIGITLYSVSALYGDYSSAYTLSPLFLVAE
jgi:hypothetical protein